MEGFVGLFDAIDGLIKFLLWACVFFVPLGLWKLIEIIIWLIHHIRLV